jgi:hypothetical protein
MIRWSFILACAVLLTSAARADDGTAKAAHAFSIICSAAIDGKPDIADIATSVEMLAAGGFKDAIVIGKTSVRAFNSSLTKQNIIITTNTYSDAREIECRSNVPVTTARDELESLARSLALEGDFFQVSAVTVGRWKRPGSQPLVFVTMTITASSTILDMQRIDVIASSLDKK